MEGCGKRTLAGKQAMKRKKRGQSVLMGSHRSVMTPGGDRVYMYAHGYVYAKIFA
jgi:hypothetical protein